jgi:hypothetical protein
MNFDPLALRPVRTALVVIVALFLAGLLARRVEEPAWQIVKARQPALRLESLGDALGQGVTVGLLGGFRAIVADLFWIRTNVVWEDNDIPKTQTLIKLVTAIDPRPLYFWQNGARMIAYDMPNWRIEAAGGYDAVPPTVQRRFDEEQSALGIKLIEDGRKFHRDDPMLILEIGNIHLNRLKDVETAARYYRLAAEQPNAPHYAARIYGELLRRLNRPREAYDWLREIYVKLPPGDSFAQAETVLGRIRELEIELSIPTAQKFQP